MLNRITSLVLSSLLFTALQTSAQVAEVECRFVNGPKTLLVVLETRDYAGSSNSHSADKTAIHYVQVTDDATGEDEYYSQEDSGWRFEYFHVNHTRTGEKLSAKIVGSEAVRLYIDGSKNQASFQEINYTGVCILPRGD